MRAPAGKPHAPCPFRRRILIDAEKCLSAAAADSGPAVTCTIPGTGKVSHMIDNLKAGAGRLPGEQQRKRMAGLIRDL
jgi:hypothetical protein